MNLHVYVEIDAVLAADMGVSLRRRLERGIYVAQLGDGRVRFEGLRSDAALVFDSFVAAVEALHVQAEADEKLAQLCGLNTATGVWCLDKAAFLRIVAREVVLRRSSLWPDDRAAE